MLYKKPIITLTSLLDLLFILIFAYQMDIKTDAEKYVQAEVGKRTSLDIPDQSELVAELQEENKRVRNELQEKERELVVVKQKSKSIQKQSKTEGVIPITDKDAELAKALVGTWKGDYNRGPASTAETVTYYANGKFTCTATLKAIRNVTINPAELHLSAGQFVSYQISGSWWVKNGYRFLLIESSNNTNICPIGYCMKDHISFVGNKVRFMKDSENIPYELYRIKGD